MALRVVCPSPFLKRVSWGGGLISGALAIHPGHRFSWSSTVPSLRGVRGTAGGAGGLGGHAVGS